MQLPRLSFFDCQRAARQITKKGFSPAFFSPSGQDFRSSVFPALTDPLELQLQMDKDGIS